MMTDAELLQRYVQEKSEQAFAQLVQRHMPLVYSAALRQLGGDTHLAQDVTQEVFTALARKADRLVGRVTLAGWLYLGTHHAVAQTIRSVRRRRTREQEAAVMHEILGAENERPNDDWSRIRPVLDEAMRHLAEPDREAVLLRYFAHRPFAEIGVALQVSTDAARMRVDRAMEKLRRALEQRGVTSSSSALATSLGASSATAPPLELAAQVSRVAFGAAHAASTGPLQFLLMNVPTLVAGAVAVAGLGLAAFQFAENRRTQTLNQQLHDTVAALRADAAAAQAQARQASDAARRSLLSESAASPRSTFAPSSQLGIGAQPRPAAFTFRSADGQVVESLPMSAGPEGRRQQTAEAARVSYAALFRKMGWTESQREQFATLFAERKEQGQRLIDAARKQGTTVDRVFAQVVWEQTGNDFDAQLRATLGDAAVAGLRKFEATKSIRNIADALARDLFYSASPLSAEKAEQFIDALAAATRTASGRIDLEAVPPETLFARAGEVLSEPQLAAFKQHELRRRQLAAMQPR